MSITLKPEGISNPLTEEDKKAIIVLNYDHWRDRLVAITELQLKLEEGRKPTDGEIVNVQAEILEEQEVIAHKQWSKWLKRLDRVAPRV